MRTTLLRAGRPVLLLAGLYTVLMARLSQGGHVPGATHGLPFPAESYYDWATLYVAPLCVGLWVILAQVAYVAARRMGGTASRAETLAALAPAFGFPLALLFVLPDLVVLELWGHAALAPAMRYYAPVALLMVWAGCARQMSRAHGISAARGLGAASLGLLVQALPAAVLLR
jgi:hypothetical protein